MTVSIATEVVIVVSTVPYDVHECVRVCEEVV